jgi:hypothetical protein
MEEPARAPERSRRQFETLAKSASVPSEIMCVVYDSLADTRHWIEMKHTNARLGSTKGWSPRQKARFDLRPDPTHQLMEWYRERAPTGLYQRYSEGKAFSNIERLIDDRDARARLGVDVVAGRIMRLADEASIVRWVSKVIRDFTEPDPEKRKKVRDIYNKDRRSAYLDEIAADLPADGNRARAPVALEASAATQPGEMPGGKKQPSTTSSLLTDRETLVHGGARFNTGQARLDGIFREFRKLSIRTKPNACAVLLRCFIDMSAHYYCTRKGLGPTDGPGSFNSNWLKACTHLMQHGGLTKAQKAAMDNLVQKQDGALTYSTLHQWVHCRETMPLTRDMIKIWAVVWPFLEAVGNVKAR